MNIAILCDIRLTELKFKYWLIKAGSLCMLVEISGKSQISFPLINVSKNGSLLSASCSIVNCTDGFIKSTWFKISTKCSCLAIIKISFMYLQQKYFKI